MMISVQKVEKGIANYLDNELIPKLPKSSVQKVFIGVGLSLAIKNLTSAVVNVRENQFIKMMGIFDENGDVDVDTLATEIKKQMGDEGIKIEIPQFSIGGIALGSSDLGAITFHKDDVDKLCEYIKS